eukprot:CAMPEP_0204614602 /NCGR_PEP_ID=MMETSP0717-20131115/2290_1 /ASSEMBLY_ACC=CAM_ASM_000666 /TAXON_ID=230516 /ORGANISM="Chaetoceros curvisetus" /LENGTH=292 /DNA_ID=CAMNT_0051627309 /DNA_START=109 /DNA_END=987 /DNA_ORIENTATION=+
MIDLPGGEKDPEVVLKMKKSKYGLGDRRSLDQLIQFSGFDLRNEKISIDGKNRCGNIQWVPFTEHPKGVNYIPQFDNLTEDPLDLPYDPSSVWYTPVEDANSNGLPEGSDLSEKHAQLEEVLEGEEVLDMDMNAKHAALQIALEEEKLVEDGLNQEHDNPVIENVNTGEVEDGDGEGDGIGGEDYGENIDLYEGNEGNHDINEEWDDGKISGNHPLDGNKFPKTNSLLRGVASIREKETIFLEKLHFQDQGFHKLPLFVQVNVFLLVFGVIYFICKSAGTGRAFKRDDRKKS